MHATMRRMLLLVLLALVPALLPQRGAAQSARGSVQASVTLVDPAQAHLDGNAVSARRSGGGWEMSTPLRVSGAGSPQVQAQVSGGDATCRTVPVAGQTSGGWLRCFVPRGSTLSRAVTEIPVTLLVSSAT
jgi:hypothetical protein